MMLAFILEGLGTTELLVILVVALILFGPRKLPQLSRSLGKSLGDFKRASEEFKRTWEKEVTLEESDKQGRIERAMLPEDDATISRTVERNRALQEAAAAADEETWDTSNNPASVALATNLASESQSEQASADAAAPASTSTTTTTTTTAPLGTEPLRKRDWL